MHRKQKDNADEYFSIAHLKSNLKDRTIKSTAVSLMAQAIKLVLQLCFIAIFARLLEPSDFGLIAMITIFTTLGMTIMEGGLSMATIQRETITHAQVSNLFWVNLALGAFITTIAILVSPIISWIYNEPRLILIMTALSVSFIVGSLSIQHEAILKRHMRFKALSFIDVSSLTIGNCAGVLAALNNLGYWALVYIPITTYIIKIALCWWMVDWRPSSFTTKSGTKPLLGFGIDLTAGNFITYFTNNITPFLLGFLGGAHFLGLYNRSFNLASIPKAQALMPVMKVLQSTLARVATDPERLRKYSLSIMSKIAIVTMLISLIMFLSAEWIILILLGDSWEEAVPILQLLAIATIATPITILTATVLVAVGETRALLKWKIITLTILLIAVAIGSNWGVWGVLWGATLSAVLIRVPLFFIYAEKYQPVKAKEFAGVVLPPIIFVILIALTLKLVGNYYILGDLFSVFVLYFVAIPIVYFAMCVLFKTTRKEIIDLINLVKSYLNRASLEN
ncbi:MAG: lipopolysaccharide biosynthesis protein [Candidatus Thiodiazotropha endolucinida]